MGRPSFRSDVFSAGLVMYRLLTGKLPEWPFEWPHPGLSALKRKVGPELIDLIRRAIDAHPRRRFADCGQMLSAFKRIKGRALAPRPRSRAGQTNNGVDWQTVRFRQFRREFGRVLKARHECEACSGPVSEAMRYCPWCREERTAHQGKVDFPATCPRCERGMKLDWRFCAWCYGGLVGPVGERTYSDVRYEGVCSNRSCRGDLMPFMRYCPWCRAKVARPWRIEGASHKCRRCAWGCLDEYWGFCPWCSAYL
jgi:hypothetical protein